LREREETKTRYFAPKCSLQNLPCKVELFSEPRELAFLSPKDIYEKLNFSTEIQIFANIAG
jgi:hypothetical protein